LYEFLWGEYCDWYIELAKIRLNVTADDKVSPLPVLAGVLDRSLRLLHPYMPFITEELWQNLKNGLSNSWQQKESIMIADYPVEDVSVYDERAERAMDCIIEVIRSIRNARAEYNVESGKWVEAHVFSGELAQVINSYSGAIQTLARAKPVTVSEGKAESVTEKNALRLVLKDAEVVIPMESMVDLEAERQRIEKEAEQTSAEVARLETVLRNEAFLTKAPAAVVDKERQKLYTLTDKLERLRQKLLDY
jgi:valyl-tRNA synthetase